MEKKALEKLTVLAAKRVIQSKAVIFTAGAGMGVDSGLPTFRGNEGFWKNYPVFQKSKMSFYEAACPDFFESNPSQYWYFYGHRYNMYTKTQPHEGFKMLLEIGEKVKNKNYFAYTSNVDGHFQKAGFPEEKVVECHGSINYCQCRPCFKIFPTPLKEVPINYDECKATTLPSCPTCKCLLRPNILMFGDYDWIRERTTGQFKAFNNFLEDYTSNVLRNSLAIIEVGAGLAVPTIRRTGEYFLFNEKKYKATLIRINMEDFDCDVPSSVLRINEGNVDKFPEAEDNKEAFLAGLEKTKAMDQDKNVKQNPMIVEIKAGGLQGIKLIYDTIKRYCPSFI